MFSASKDRASTLQNRGEAVRGAAVHVSACSAVLYAAAAANAWTVTCNVGVASTSSINVETGAWNLDAGTNINFNMICMGPHP